MKSLCALDDDISPAAERHSLAETALDLAGDAEIVENRGVLGIELHYVLVLGRDKRHVVLDLRESLGLVDIDVLKIRAEHVADHAHSARVLFIDEAGGLASLHLGNGILPAFHQRPHLIVEFRHFLIFSRCAHNHTEPFGLDRADKLAEAYFLLGGFYFLRNGNLVSERHQHHVASGKRNFGG